MSVQRQSLALAHLPAPRQRPITSLTPLQPLMTASGRPSTTGGSSAAPGSAAPGRPGASARPTPAAGVPSALQRSSSSGAVSNPLVQRQPKLDGLAELPSAVAPPRLAVLSSPEPPGAQPKSATLRWDSPVVRSAGAHADALPLRASEAGPQAPSPSLPSAGLGLAASPAAGSGATGSPTTISRYAATTSPLTPALPLQRSPSQAVTTASGTSTSATAALTAALSSGVAQLDSSGAVVFPESVGGAWTPPDQQPVPGAPVVQRTQSGPTLQAARGEVVTSSAIAPEPPLPRDTTEPFDPEKLEGSKLDVLALRLYRRLRRHLLADLRQEQARLGYAADRRR